MRSTSLQFEIAAGPVSSAVLQAAGADQEQFTISNGKDAAARRLLRNAVVQLYDSHSNPACVAGVLARWRLYCSDGNSVRAGAQAPVLCVATGELQLQSNDKGRAFFGDVGVEEGTGKMVSWDFVGLLRRSLNARCCAVGTTCSPAAWPCPVDSPIASAPARVLSCRSRCSLGNAVFDGC